MHDRAVVRGPARNLKVRISEDLAQQLEGYAQEREISISDAVRVLLRNSLSPAVLPEEIKVLPAVAFATLLAAEQGNCLDEQFHSTWFREHGYNLAGSAAEAARKRLQEVELALEEPRRRYRPWDEKPSRLANMLGQSR